MALTGIFTTVESRLFNGMIFYADGRCMTATLKPEIAAND